MAYTRVCRHARKRAKQRYSLDITDEVQDFLFSTLMRQEFIPVHKLSTRKTIFVALLDPPYPDIMCFLYNTRLHQISTFLPLNAIVSSLWYGNNRCILRLDQCTQIIELLEKHGEDLSKPENDWLAETKRVYDWQTQHGRGFRTKESRTLGDIFPGLMSVLEGEEDDLDT